MRILITTGIYPPKTSGPAQYAKNMEDLWRKMGHEVIIKTYTTENLLPTGFRHLWFLVKILPSVLRSEVIFSLDTFSVGFPSVLIAKILKKKVVIRTGGDFIWENYIERTGDMVLLKDFYKTRMNRFSFKDKITFSITKWTLSNTNLLVFSTSWQMNIFLEPYGLNKDKTYIVENHYDRKEKNNYEISIPKNRTFVAGARKLKLKNNILLQNVFDKEEIKSTGARLDINNAPFNEFVEKMRDAYAVIQASLSDISPHMISDAINLDKPFILTEENGLTDRIKDISIMINPKDENDIKEKILWILNEENYKRQVEKIRNFSFVHTWEEIAQEYITIFNRIK
ncbi:MAG: hypothetical protein CEO12_196 [Parcubacteria group bacterium Gr01-1014_46]|nr:MAG: hypothetical protein CEO12_196 [Parcubacteria group bacterium Gr01-1014_46]